MSGFEGVGEAVTGGLLARAVEPAAGEHGTGHGDACLNCGAGLIGEHCHRCGQAAHVHRSLHSFFHDLLHSVFHFEGKIWRTLPMLAFRPGELTRRYIAGERARFVSPIALFLFSVFLMFAVFSWVGTPFGSDEPAIAGGNDLVADLRQERAESLAAIKAAETDVAEARAEGRSAASAERRLAKAKQDFDVQRQALQVAERVARTGTSQARSDSGNDKLNIKTGWVPLDHAIEKSSENPSLLAYKLQSNAYKFSWALIPISVPFLWLCLFWKRGYRLYDHIVFVTYSLAFMSLGAILLSLVRPLGVTGGLAGLALVLIPPLHIYAQLKGAYRLSRFSALWRTVFLLFAAMIASLGFFTLLLALGAFH